MNINLLEKIVRVNSSNSTIPLWVWNGWSSQWVELVSSSEKIAEAEANAKQKGYAIFTPEDGVLVVVNGYDFYGWREEVVIYTTHQGKIVLDEDDNLQGDWLPG